MKSVLPFVALLLSAGSLTLAERPSSRRLAVFRPFTKLRPRKSLQSLGMIPVTHTSMGRLQTLSGGACSDSGPAFLVKIAVPAVLESFAMLGVIVGTKSLGERFKKIPSIAGLSLVQWLGLFVNIFASSFVGSVVGGGLSAATNQVLDPNVVPGDPEWYSKLNKPSWTPPGWVFPIMWLIVSKPTQMIAVSKILKMEKKPGTLRALWTYCAHLALGDAWNKVFFGMQCIGRGTAVITIFYEFLLASVLTFYKLKPAAGLYLLPTVGWVTVATALQWSIFFKNR